MCTRGRKARNTGCVPDRVCHYLWSRARYAVKYGMPMAAPCFKSSFSRSVYTVWYEASAYSALLPEMVAVVKSLSPFLKVDTLSSILSQPHLNPVSRVRVVFFCKYQTEYMFPWGLHHMRGLWLEPVGLLELVLQHTTGVSALLVHQIKKLQSLSSTSLQLPWWSGSREGEETCGWLTGWDPT